MDRQHYEQLLNLAERGDLAEGARLRFIEEAEAMFDAPGGVTAALHKMVRALARLSDKDSASATYLREAIRLLRQLQ